MNDLTAARNFLRILDGAKLANFPGDNAIMQWSEAIPSYNVGRVRFKIAHVIMELAFRGPRRILKGAQS